MSLLLKNALVFDPQSKYHNQEKNILVKDGQLVSFNTTKADEIVDCKGKLVTPGWFDLNADFCDPGNEHKEDIDSGSLAGSYGGFTDVQLVMQSDPIIDSKSDVEYVLSRSKDSVDLHVSASISEGQKGENLTEMLDLYHYGARSFSDGDHQIWNAELLLKALQYTSKLDKPIFQNARDLNLSAKTHMHEGANSTILGLRGEPSLSEELMIGRDIDILKYSGGRLHFTKISTKKGVELIRKAKKEGLNVTCDVAIHHLLFTDFDVGDFDTVYKAIPPYRTKEDRDALIAGIQDGTIDAICSNHRPQDQESKQLEFDLAEPGSTALQTFFSSLMRIEGPTFETLIDKVTAGPRRVLGLDTCKIEDGMQAKLTILAKQEKWLFSKEINKSKSMNSPFLGKELTGKVVGTINRKKVSWF